MLNAAFWGLIQGLTEFLPISSSGHLVLVPALFGQEPPDLATTAVLHLGTLAAVLIYFRKDLREILRFTPDGKRLLWFMLIGTIPAGILGLAFRGALEDLNENPQWVAVALIGTGCLLIGTRWLALGKRTQNDTTPRDAIIMGLGQALALIPGVSRSGTTISTGLAQGYERRDAASLAFLLGIPAIAGAGLLTFVDLASEGGGGINGALLVGMLVAGVSGYWAIAFLLNLIRRTGLVPFGIYCVAFGALSLVLL